MNKKDREWLKKEYEYYNAGPGPYQDSLDYHRFEAKAEALEEVLDHLCPSWRGDK